MRELDRASRQSASKMKKQPSMSQMQRSANAEFYHDGCGPLFPGTFISLPLARHPKPPYEFAQYSWARLKAWIAGTTSILGFKLQSMPSWTTRPRWKARRGQIAPTAKAMYREMLEAFAAGDKAALHSLCLGDFAKKLSAAIDRRDPKHGVRFQLLKYNSRLLYPRLMSHRIYPMNQFDKDLYTEQAVVAIASTQQASRYDTATGETVPGSLRLQDKMEYVVLSRQASSKTYETGSWRIWGTTSATTLETHLQEMAVVEREQAKQSGWDGSSSK